MSKRKQIEIERNAQPQTSYEITRYQTIEKLKAEASPNILEPFLTNKKVSEILGRPLNKKEKKAWTTHRSRHFQEINRTKQMAEAALRQQNHQRELRPNPSELLVGLDNQSLIKKIRHLNRLHLQPGATGKAATNQLISKLAIHTNEQIGQIVKQIETFTVAQSNSAMEEIETIQGIWNALEIRRREDIGMLNWTIQDYFEDIITVHEAARKYDFPLFPYDLFSFHLKKILTLDGLYSVLNIAESLEANDEVSDKMIDALIFTIKTEFELRKLSVSQTDEKKDYMDRIAEVENYITLIPKRKFFAPVQLEYIKHIVRRMKIDEQFFTKEIREKLMVLCQ